MRAADSREFTLYGPSHLTVLAVFVVVAAVLDVLGPWPVYLLPEIALVLTVWALMTWPWTRSRTRDAPAR
ncbi:hypothetical protein [Haloechinothrix salitolerans]|uniref:MYXO-CTERM domain-containing protein n=1 Tax=Haloechinothrix salitolerans TaxID=926830 RepID=A0ABW2C3D8_9PSEU